MVVYSKKGVSKIIFLEAENSLRVKKEQRAGREKPPFSLPVPAAVFVQLSRYFRISNLVVEVLVCPWDFTVVTTM
jgi:hypothetical protein